MKVGNVKAVKKKLGELIAKYKENTTERVVVGYTQNYAVFVHENLEARHAGHTLYSSRRKKWYPGVGQAKFLEDAIKNNLANLRKIIYTILKAKQPAIVALKAAGLFIQAESQKLCPVDTGALRGSAFTRTEPNSQPKIETTTTTE